MKIIDIILWIVYVALIYWIIKSIKTNAMLKGYECGYNSGYDAGVQIGELNCKTDVLATINAINESFASTSSATSKSSATNASSSSATTTKKKTAKNTKLNDSIKAVKKINASSATKKSKK